MAVSEAIAKVGERSRPPHLRQGTQERSCATCMYFRPKSLTAGACRLYGSYPVQASQLCNSYRAKGS
jgi:hypothetical protein